MTPPSSLTPLRQPKPRKLWCVSFFQLREGMEGGEKAADNNGAKKVMSPCDVEALKKCLEENKGDYLKCQSQIEAFKSACSLKKPSSVPSVESAP
ncbi:hypothetical protein NL676_016440 [Syzygium grande]|nr:hypothetical protein NL676_016440 [Syzygium grande]